MQHLAVGAVGRQLLQGCVPVVHDGQHRAVGEHPDARLPAAVGPHDLGRGVAAAVVEDDIVPVAVALREDALHCFGEVLGAVEHRRDDRDLWFGGHDPRPSAPAIKST